MTENNNNFDQFIQIKNDLYLIYKKTNLGHLIHKASLGIAKEPSSYTIIKTEKVQQVNTSYDVNINGVSKSGSKLRPAQLGAIHATMAHWSLSKEPATIVLPTGTGKTETMLAISLLDQANRTLVVVPNIDLKKQIANKFISWGMLRQLGVIPELAPNPKVLILNRTINNFDDINLLEEADVTVTTPALIARTSDEIKSKISDIFSHVFFDEAHHIVANEWNNIKTLYKSAKIVQFTATPYREDRKPIEGKIVYNYPLSKALEDKCFSKISLIRIDERNPHEKDRVIANAAMEKLIQDRQNGFTRHKMMVRAENKKAAKNLCDQYTSWFPNERIVLVHSGIKQRKAVVQDIINDKYDIVICVDMLKEGFDYPNFKIAAVHGVHKSLSVLLQFIGRFTRTQEDLGDATFIINFAEDVMSAELENLFQEGSGWEKVISEIADARKAKAESLLKFLQGCQPYSGFDSPDIKLNPRIVYPALSSVFYKTDQVNWDNFVNAFNLKQYALSQPYVNTEENIFYFTTQIREKVKWARVNNICHQEWGLIVMCYDKERSLLYIGHSEKKLDVDFIAETIANNPEKLHGDCVFRAFHEIKRLNIVHAGIFKPANHLHRYSRLSGADVTIELSRWREGKKCKKSDFVGVGFRNGNPVSIGASIKGKIWSPARVGNIKEWKTWCEEIGKLLLDNAINSDQLLQDSAKKEQINNFNKCETVLCVDWSEILYDRMHRLELSKKSAPPDTQMLSEATIKYISKTDGTANFVIKTLSEDIEFQITLGGENGFSIDGLDQCDWVVEKLKRENISLKQFLQENPPTLFLLNGCTVSGSLYTDYGHHNIYDIPDAHLHILDWKDVNFTTESYYKNGDIRQQSIQEYLMKYFIKKGAKIVFNDDNAGESADIIAIFQENNLIKFQMVHCKYSKETAGARLSDLYEVCGQTIVSLRYKWKPEALITHMIQRNSSGVLKDKRFYHGSIDALKDVQKAVKYCNVEFSFALAQPGVSKSKLTDEMKSLLGSIHSTTIEMTETQLQCYFSA